MATILYPDGTSREVQPANGTDFTLDELKAIVEGSIEIIPCKAAGLIMVLNEQGKLLDLPRNDQAGALVHLRTSEDVKAMQALLGDTLIVVGDPDEEDYIAGTVLVCRNDEVR
jgi:hypothetical protein